MVEIGKKPILWHIMKIFASYGHTDFIVCTGYKAEFIEDYFYNFNLRSNDFTTNLGDHAQTEFHGSPQEHNWKVTVAHTGLDTPTGGRIKAIQSYVEGERFFCTYGDGIAPVDLDALLRLHETNGGIASMTVTRPVSRFGVVDFDDNGIVSSFSEKPGGASFVNIGYFVFEPEIFQVLSPSAVLEEDSLPAIAESGQLNAYAHDGFWQPMDTYRETLILNDLWQKPSPPWKIWD
jgi:glucose-1-phosphate cytidylyltransferase